MTVTLRSHQDIALAFRKLGLPADALESRKALERALGSAPSVNATLANELKDVVFSKMNAGERERLAAFLGAAPAESTPVVVGGGNVGGTGVNRFALEAMLDKKGRLQENLPDVARLLERHKVSGVVDRPFERVLVHAAKIDSLLRDEPDADQLVELVMKKDLRRQVFLLEGISKLYVEIHGKRAEKVYEKVKHLEDHLGRLSMTRSNLAAAEKVGADPRVLSLLQKDMESSRVELRNLLQAEWMPDSKGRIPGLRDVVEKWGEAKWGSYDKDFGKVRHELARRLEKLESTPFDMDELENGIHELRRQLRWFPIYAEALSGVFQLNEKQHPVSGYRKLLRAEIADSKFVQLPDGGREQSSIDLSKSLYCGLMQLVLDLGALKDSGEPLHFIRDAYLRAGLAPDQKSAAKTVTRLFGDAANEKEIHERAHALYGAMKHNGLVRALRLAVEPH
jgi:hypothetical protein